MTLWVPDLERAQESWSWLLGQLGYVLDPSFDGVVVLRHPEGFAVALEQSSDMVPGMLYSRMRPGLNHMAFNLAPHSSLDDIAAEGRGHGRARARTHGRALPSRRGSRRPDARPPAHLPEAVEGRGGRLLRRRRRRLA